MLPYNRKTPNDAEQLLKTQKKNPSKIHMADINRIESAVDIGNTVDNAADKNVTDDSKKKDSENILNMGMNIDPSTINSKILDPTTNTTPQINTQHLNTLHLQPVPNQFGQFGQFSQF